MSSPCPQRCHITHPQTSYITILTDITTCRLTCLVFFVLHLLYIAFTFLRFSHDIPSSRSGSIRSRRSASISLLCVTAWQGMARCLVGGRGDIIACVGSQCGSHSCDLRGSLRTMFGAADCTVIIVCTYKSNSDHLFRQFRVVSIAIVSLRNTFR